ncbi:MULTISPECIES: acyl-CoA dehydrogenase family protein [unclassified Nocardioides]|uniref:acyl-CoA dehydrogenase family protein n=1 Tax=unclassified Nocardioides TaxID=2615069 RepID=UPI000702CFC0|nr:MULTISPECIES: acyl-CoA dehydrogenase family protein [unclassified Nocardioides]KRC53800.1 acyl-CoA dehydrogenase [Nocardioides sp. Root79]KRC71135.1 acyl-CoA dehydrogenase [Nocardioides sp. Root240]
MSSSNAVGAAPRDEHVNLRREVRALVETWRQQGRYQPRSDSWLRGFDPAFSKELARRGLIGITWPTDVGGRGLSNTARLAVTEELLRAGAPVAAHWVGDRQIGPAIIRHGSETLRKEILPGIVAADYVFCLGMSEPEAGSDLASLRTTATKVDGGWVIKGRKIWTSGAHHATHMYLLARTSRGEKKQSGLTEFILDMDTSGISVSPIVDLAGEHHFNEVLFEDAFVPDGRVLGSIDNGWAQVVEQLSFERGGPERFLSTYPVFAELLDVARDGVIDVRADLGHLVARLATLRQLAWQVARALDAGEAPVQQAATLKYLGNAFEHDVLEVARKAYSDSGLRPGRLRNDGFRQALLASPGYSIRGGAAEVLLSLIARQEVK